MLSSPAGFAPASALWIAAMTTRLNRRTTAAAAAVLAVFLATGRVAYAEAPEISKAEVNLANGVIVVSGNYFGPNNGRLVLAAWTGNYDDLVVTSWSDTQVVALLPPKIASGSYRL